jgi:hypothetical protein
LHAHCLDVLKDAVRFRPPSVLKFAFFERLIQTGIQNQAQPQGHSVVPDPAAALVTGIRIITAFMVRRC